MRSSACEPLDGTVTAAYAGIAAAFTAFAVWGSLFPFDFHRVSIATAALRFWSGSATDVARWSLTDLISNVLLFLPIGAFAGAAYQRWWRRPAREAAVITTVGAIALSGVIEFAQAFVSWRTPSVVDVGAEACGAAIGIAMWHYVRVELDRFLEFVIRALGASKPHERVLLGCCLAFTAGSWVPADFTLRPGEIGDKYAHKRLLAPFAASPDAATGAELAATAAFATPLGVAAVLCGCGPRARRSAGHGTLLAGVGIIIIGAVQVTVFSRTTDATAILAALGGALAGSLASTVVRREQVVPIDARMLKIAAVVTLWIGVALTLEWWPFHLTLDAPRARVQAMLWSRAPFRAPASALDLIPGALVALAAGAFARPRFHHDFVRLQTMLLIGFAAVALTVVECGRLLLVGGRPTLASVLFKVAALAAGVALGATHSAAPMRVKTVR